MNVELKNDIINKLNEIILINNDDWNNLDINIKIKLIHHYCNILNDNTKQIINYDEKRIPLKSLKPKKLIEYASFNKQTNKKMFIEYLDGIQKITNEFREKYKKKQVHYTYNSISNIEYNRILSLYSKYVYNFLYKYKSIIKVENLYNQLINKNDNKIISNENKIMTLEILENKNNIELKFNNHIIILLEIYLTSNKITNNIPVKFSVKLINKF